MDLNKWKNRAKKIGEIMPSKDALQGIIDGNTLEELRKGHVYVSDAAINEMIERQISKSDGAPVKRANLSSHPDGKISIEIDSEKLGIVTFLGRIKEFTCKKGKAVFIYDVEEHHIRETKIVAWLFSQVSLGVMGRFIKFDKFHELIDTRIEGNTITVNFSGILSKSKIGKAEINGIRFLDILEIENATPKEGGIEIKARLDLLNQANEKIKTLFR